MPNLIISRGRYVSIPVNSDYCRKSPRGCYLYLSHPGRVQSTIIKFKRKVSK